MIHSVDTLDLQWIQTMFYLFVFLTVFSTLNFNKKSECLLVLILSFLIRKVDSLIRKVLSEKLLIMSRTQPLATD